MGLVGALLIGVLLAGACRWMIDAVGRLLLALGRDRAAWLGHHTVAEPAAVVVGLAGAAVAWRWPDRAALLLTIAVGVTVAALTLALVARLLRRAPPP